MMIGGVVPVLAPVSTVSCRPTSAIAPVVPPTPVLIVVAAVVVPVVVDPGVVVPVVVVPPDIEPDVLPLVEPDVLLVVLLEPTVVVAPLLEISTPSPVTWLSEMLPRPCTALASCSKLPETKVPFRLMVIFTTPVPPVPAAAGVMMSVMPERFT